MPPRGFILLMSGKPSLCLNPHMLAISEVSLQELLQNALIHLDLLNHAAIRLLVFSDRVEIVNPGFLHGGLEVGDLELGISRRRNPLMAQLASRTMPCCAVRSGIIRVLREDTGGGFDNMTSACQFKVTITRKAPPAAPGDGRV